MGIHHVPITIDENNLVTSISNVSGEIYETCVLCNKLTDIPITMHIDLRYGYVEGSGQCCKECYQRTNSY